MVYIRSQTALILVLRRRSCCSFRRRAGEISGNIVKNCDIYLVDYDPTATHRGAGEVCGYITNTEMANNNRVSGNNVQKNIECPKLESVMNTRYGLSDKT